MPYLSQEQMYGFSISWLNQESDPDCECTKDFTGQIGRWTSDEDLCFEELSHDVLDVFIQISVYLE